MGVGSPSNCADDVRGRRNTPHPMHRTALSTAAGIVKAQSRTTVLKMWAIIIKSFCLAHELEGDVHNLHLPVILISGLHSASHLV